MRHAGDAENRSRSPNTPEAHDVTRLLHAWNDGDEQALDRLTPLLYRELHRIAHRYLRRERQNHTLQTTALVNESYVRLIKWRNIRWQNRAQFLGVLAQLMRRVLVDFARSRAYDKRGGALALVTLDEADAAAPTRPREILALDEVLQTLSAIDRRKGQIVELRFFGGLTLQETAEVLNVSSRTVLREWDLAKAWLRRELEGSGGRGAQSSHAEK